MRATRATWTKIGVFAAAATLAVSLVGCGPAERTEAPAEPESSAESSASAEETADDTEAAAEQPEPVEIEVDQTIVDDQLGYTIAFKKAIIDLPFDNANIWADGYRTGVGVEVELTNNSEYVTILSGSDISLLVNGEKVNVVGGNGDSAFQTFAGENGLVGLPITGASQGESISGWLFYYFDTGSGDNELALRYTRQETKVNVIGGADGGSSYMIPAENFDVPL